MSNITVGAITDGAIAALVSQEEKNWTPETGLIAILRGRLEGKGPITADLLAAPLGIDKGLQAALMALETEGFAMRGRFSPESIMEEWCERRLLARIHSYTVKRLRAEIEPVSARDFLRNARIAHGTCGKMGSRAQKPWPRRFAATESGSRRACGRHLASALRRRI